MTNIRLFVRPPPPASKTYNKSFSSKAGGEKNSGIGADGKWWCKGIVLVGTIVVVDEAYGKWSPRVRSVIIFGIKDGGGATIKCIAALSPPPPKRFRLTAGLGLAGPFA